MCVIIQRNKDIIVPFDKIKVACEINKDGYGFVINDRGKFDVIKHYDPKGNDPDKVMKLMEDAKDCNVALHLRFRTAGLTDLDNTHPYQVLNKDKDGVDLWFMHNGTLNEWKDINKDYSDSRNLNDVVLKQLFKAAYDQYGEEYLNQVWLIHATKALKGSTSAFTFNDSLGGRLILGSSGSKEFEGWWASNEYSFRETHYRYNNGASTQSYGETFGAKGSRDGNFTQGKTTPVTNGQLLPPYRSHGGGGQTQTTPTTGQTTPTGQPTTDKEFTISAYANMQGVQKTWGYETATLRPRIIMSTAVEIEANFLREQFKNIMEDTDAKALPHVKVQPGSTFTPTFEEIAGIKDLKDLTRISTSDLEVILASAPEAAAILVQELLVKVYGQNYVNQVRDRAGILKAS